MGVPYENMLKYKMSKHSGTCCMCNRNYDSENFVIWSKDHEHHGAKDN